MNKPGKTKTLIIIDFYYYPELKSCSHKAQCLVNFVYQVELKISGFYTFKGHSFMDNLLKKFILKFIYPNKTY